MSAAEEANGARPQEDEEKRNGSLPPELQEIISYSIIESRVSRARMEALNITTALQICDQHFSKLSVRLAGQLLCAFAFCLRQKVQYYLFDVRDFVEQFKRQNLLAKTKKATSGKKKDEEEEEGTAAKKKIKRGKRQRRNTAGDDEDDNNEEGGERPVLRKQNVILEEMSSNAIENPRHMMAPQDVDLQQQQTPMRADAAAQDEFARPEGSVSRNTDSLFRERLRTSSQQDLKDLNRRADASSGKVTPLQFQNEQFDELGQAMFDSGEPDQQRSGLAQFSSMDAQQAALLLDEKIGVDYVERKEDVAEVSASKKDKKKGQNAKKTVSTRVIELIIDEDINLHAREMQQEEPNAAQIVTAVQEQVPKQQSAVASPRASLFNAQDITALQEQLNQLRLVPVGESFSRDQTAQKQGQEQFLNTTLGAQTRRDNTTMDATALSASAAKGAQRSALAANKQLDGVLNGPLQAIRERRGEETQDDEDFAQNYQLPAMEEYDEVSDVLRQSLVTDVPLTDKSVTFDATAQRKELESCQATYREVIQLLAQKIQTDFDQVCTKVKKRSKAAIFYDLLTLAKFDRVELEQEDEGSSFQPIYIKLSER